MAQILDSFRQDVTLALRGMRKRPAVAFIIVVSLALAMAADVSIYSVVDAAILRHLPVREPQKLFTLTMPAVVDPGAQPDVQDVFSYPLFRNFKDAAGKDAQLAAFSPVEQSELTLGRDGIAVEKISTQYVSGNAFEMLGVRPVAGRLFDYHEDQGIGGHAVAVLGYDYWRRRFNESGDVVGRTLRIADKDFVVVGVAAKDFFGIEPGKFVDVWIPATMYTAKALTASGWEWIRIMGRLAPDARIQQLQVMLQQPFHESRVNFVKGFPTMPDPIRDQFTSMQLRVEPAPTGVSQFRRTFAKTLWIVFFVAISILLIACSNVATMMLARAVARSGEMALRISLGAVRTRLIRQLLTESLVLSLAAGCLGWAMACFIAPVLVRCLSYIDPVQLSLAMDTRVLFFALAVSTCAAVTFGVIPAWRCSATSPIAILRQGTGQTPKLRLGHALVGVQVAFSFGLILIGCGFVFSFFRLSSVHPGFDPANVLVLSIQSSLPAGQNATQRLAMEQARQQISAQSGISGVAVGMSALFRDTPWGEQVQVPGQAISATEEMFAGVSPEYFRTLRTPMVAGSDFDSRTNSGAAVPVIVNEAFAKRYFGGNMQPGSRFLRPAQNPPVQHVVIGVVSNSHFQHLRENAKPTVYVPYIGASTYTMYVRSTLGPASIARQVDRALQDSGFRGRIREVVALEALIGNSMAKERLLAGIGAIGALLGVLVAGFGLFGLLNYTIARQVKEIGIRSALGAQRPALVLFVLKDLMVFTASGLLIGSIAAAFAMRALASLLFGMRAADPLVILTAACIFFIAIVAAAALPARRVAAIEPSAALRTE